MSGLRLKSENRRGRRGKAGRPAMVRAVMERVATGGRSDRRAARPRNASRASVAGRRRDSDRSRVKARAGSRGRPRKSFCLPRLSLPRIVWHPKRLGVAAAALVLVTGMVLVITSAPGWGRGGDRFLLSRFEVKGNRVLTEQEVLELSGLTMGSRLLDVRVSELESSVAASPRVERAHAVRALPGRVIVTLDECLPEALVFAGPGALLEVAGDGRVLPPAARSQLVDLPVITGAVGTPQAGDEHVSDDIMEALSFLRLAKRVSEGLWSDISEVRIAPGSGLVIYTVADGAEIRVGSGALEPNDLKRLWHVLADIRDRGKRAESIDLRFKDQVVVRLS